MKQMSLSRIHRWFALLACCLLPGLLSACGGGGSGGSGGATPSATQAPTPSPTQAPSLTTYTGPGFTIGYPQGWTVKKSGNLVTITDASGTSAVAIDYAANPGGTVPPTTALNAGLQAFKGSAKNYKQVSVPATTSVGDANWNQQAATGDLTHQGQTITIKIVGLATNHPPQATDTRLYFIAYQAPQQTFDQQDSSVFQPMLKSFKFTS